MAFTESYVQPTGSNLNAGSTTSDTATYTSTNGGWNSGTGVFSPASGNPSTTVSVGMFASVFVDGATVTGFVGRVTAVTSTTLTVSLTAKSGTIPTTGASGISCKVGGAWRGPNGAEAFPLGFIAAAQTNAAGDVPRVNGKGTSNITAAMTHANAGPVTFQGYTSAAGDGGRWIIDGGTSGASYVLLTVSGASTELYDLTFGNNGASGSAAGLAINASSCRLGRVVVHDVRGHGFSLNASGILCVLDECEAYSCNQSNTSNTGGFAPNNRITFIRCLSHDNSGSNSSGFVMAGSSNVFNDCGADTNGQYGFNAIAGSTQILLGCDTYSNGSEGFFGNNGAGFFYLENCNFVKNGGYGVNLGTSGTRTGLIRNCGFGSGTQANTSGATNGTGNATVSGSIIYPADTTPWVDPAVGDFRISLAQAKGAGRGAFTQTQAGYAGTVAYPDIGAGQHQDSGGVLPQRRRLVYLERTRIRRSVVLLPGPTVSVPTPFPVTRTRQHQRAAYPVRWRQPFPVQAVASPVVQSVVITSPRIVR